MVGIIREQIVVKDGQVCEDHTYAKKIRGNAIDMMLDVDDTFGDPKYVKGLLDMINGHATIMIFDMESDKDFVDPTRAKEEINTTSDNGIDMALDVDDAFGDPEYVTELLKMINGNTTITIFGQDGVEDFVDPECLAAILDIAENNNTINTVKIQQNPNSTLHNSIVSNSRNQNNRPLRVTNSKNRYPNNTPYNRRERNGNGANHFYNLRSGSNNNKAR